MGELHNELFSSADARAYADAMRTWAAAPLEQQRQLEQQFCGAQFEKWKSAREHFQRWYTQGEKCAPVLSEIDWHMSDVQEGISFLEPARPAGALAASGGQGTFSPSLKGCSFRC